MQVNIYKDKYIRAKNAYKNLENNYSELVEVFNDTKQTIINSLKNLKHDEHSDLYDIGFNNGIEESIAVVADMSVPLIFESEKPSLLITRLEYELLKHWNKKYKYIARDKDGSLYVYKDKPSKKEDVWCSLYGNCRVDRCIDDLLHFISWVDKEPMSIEKLLNNCDVIESD